MKGILAGRWRRRDFAMGVALAVVADAAVAGGPWPRRLAGVALGLPLPAAVALTIASEPPSTIEGPSDDGVVDERVGGGGVSGPADVVTFVRSVLAGCAVAGALTPETLGEGRRTWRVAGFAIPALALDAVDGIVARTTGTASTHGARLDTETDAAVFLLLSGVAARTVTPWALVIGVARYAFVAGGRVRPAWRADLPPSRRRRAIAALQGVALSVALAPVVRRRVGRVLLTSAAAALVGSFGRDIALLETRRDSRRFRPRT